MPLVSAAVLCGLLSLIVLPLVHPRAPSRPATPGSFVGASFDTAGRVAGQRRVSTDGGEGGLLQLDSQTAKITTLAPDADTYTYEAAAFDPAAGVHYFFDGDSIAKYDYRNASFGLGELYLVDSRLCPGGLSCFGEFHWSSRYECILGVGLDWPTPGKASIVKIDPNRWSAGQFGTFWLNTTLVMPLPGVGSYIEGESEYDDTRETFYLTREVVPQQADAAEHKKGARGANSSAGHQYAVHSFDLAKQTQRVLVPTYAPLPFVLLPHTGELLGFNAGDPAMAGAALALVDISTGRLSPFSRGTFRFTGLPAENTLAVDPVANVAVVTVFDLSLPASNPTLYTIDLSSRNVTGPTVLTDVLRFQRYYH